MDITKKIGPWREVGKRLLVITIYSIIMALNYKSFVQAGDLFPGGFTGLTRLAQRCAQEFWGVTLPFAPINLVLNAIPAAVSFKLIGKRFTLFSCVVILCTSLLTVSPSLKFKITQLIRIGLLPSCSMILYSSCYSLICFLAYVFLRSAQHVRRPTE